MGCQWPQMGRDMLKQLPPFAKAFQECHDALIEVDFDLRNLVENGRGDCYANPLHSFVAICAIQVSLKSNLPFLLELFS